MIYKKVIENTLDLGSGTVLQIPKNILLQRTPLYDTGWRALLKGKGKYALILGAGPATREILYAFEEQDLQSNLPVIHCFDIAPPPKEFTDIRARFPQVEMEYHSGIDLANFLPQEDFIKNTRLISIHGVLDYLTPEAVKRLFLQIAKIKSETISIRLCLTVSPWEIKFAIENADLTQRETESIERLRKKQVEVVNIDEFTNSIMQMRISMEAKVAQNLKHDYPASYFLPDKLAGYMKGIGYNHLQFLTYNPQGGNNYSALLMVFDNKD